MEELRGGGGQMCVSDNTHVCTVQTCYVMSGTKQAILCLSSAGLSQLITCQEMPDITKGRHRAGLHIIPLLKVSDCTEIITHEIDSGISLKDLGMSGGFVQKN